MNEPFIPYAKLQKKQQRALNREKRGTWGELCPVTRREKPSRQYDRKQENRRWRADARKGPTPSGGFWMIARA